MTHLRRSDKKKKKSASKKLKKSVFLITLACIFGLCTTVAYIFLSPNNDNHHDLPTQFNTPLVESTSPPEITKSTPRFSNISANEAAVRIPVLMYHDVQEIEHTTDNNVIPKHTFETQLQWLKANNYTTITAQEFMDAYQGKILLPKNSVLLTLDDGFKSIKTIVNPLLKQYDMYAISFIIGSYKERVEWHLTEAEIQEVAQDQRIAFESHTYDLHKDGNQRGIINETPIDEIVADNQKNEQVIHHKTNIFCYPFGAYSDNAIEGLKKSEIPFAFAINFGQSNWVELNQMKTSPLGDVQNPLFLPRVRINGNISIETFAALLTDQFQQ